MPVEFEWDVVKAATNLDKHGVSFAEAMTVFGDPRRAGSWWRRILSVKGVSASSVRGRQRQANREDMSEC